ncbi:hypothetical protein EDB85DRAFT_2143136 [Lactarius pseudohatsudake]|nr:hypothetical protein EDB85DRAFT_2143136 [Lactarius pseudohatsudake]
MDTQFVFPQVQVPNAPRASCTPPTQGSSPPSGLSGSTGSNPTTHYTTPPQAPSTQRAFHLPGHHTQTPWSPCRTSPPRIPSPNFNQASPVYDPALLESPRRTGLTTSFVDMVANNFGFGDRDQEFRAGLHSFTRMGKDLSNSDLATHMYTLAILYEVMRELRSRAESLQRFEMMLTDVSARLESTFNFTNEQKVNIRLIAGQVIFEPKRVSYMQIHLDVEARIRENQNDLHFTNIYCNLSHQKLLMSAIKCACSSVRNGYCEMIRNSVDDDDSKNSTLNDFVYEVANRFHPSNVSRFINTHTIQHVAILRRFALENPKLLGVGEAEDEDDDYGVVPGGAGTGPNPEARDGDGPTDPLRPGSAASTTTNGSRGKKRKRVNHQKGGDFWSMVEKWFAARTTSVQYGPAWNSPGWKTYIKETVDNDHMRFRPRTVENPYLADFEPGVGTGTTDTEGPGNAVATSAGSSVFRAASAMASILDGF